MRIAIFSDCFYPELGGIQDSILFLAKELSKRGHRINFYVPNYPPEAFRIINEKVEEIDLGKNIKVCRFFSLPIPNSTEQSRLVLPMGWRWLKIKKFKPDIIHSNTFLGVGLEALITAKILNTPLIGTNHFAITEFYHYFPFIKRELFAKISLKYVVWYYNFCNFVTVPSRSVIQEMDGKGFNRPHYVVSNPIDLEVFNQGLSINKKKLKDNFNLSGRSIVYAGKLAKEKDINVIIRALTIVKKEIQDINFAIAGHGSEEKELKKLAKELGLEKNIQFLGTLDKRTLADLYRASEIFVITSTSENQSMVTLQAMACGLPCIGVNWRSMPELINKENGFLVEVGDYKTLAKKIIYLLKNEGQRKKMGDCAFSFVQKFSSENIAKEWEKIYLNAVNNK